MANLVGSDNWDGVYQLETVDPVLGGEGGVSNRQAQNLLNRIERIRVTLASFGVDVINKVVSEPTTSRSGVVKKATDSNILNGTTDVNSFIDIPQFKRYGTVVVDTIADLRLITPTNNYNTVLVRGYTTISDGGGGPIRHGRFGYAPGTFVDNGGSVIVPTGNNGSAAWVFTPKIYNVVEFGADPTGVTLSTQNIQNAIDACGDFGVVYSPKGNYRVRELTITEHGVKFIGDGSYATQYTYDPTGDGVCLTCTKDTVPLSYLKISGIAFYSANETYSKTAIMLNDINVYEISDINISGSLIGHESRFWGGGDNGSTGIVFKGRDEGSIHNIMAFCDYPIRISQNPNSTLSMDHHHFYDLYLGANGNPLITIDTGVNLSNVSFDGYQAWVLGSYGVYWNDTTSVGISNNIIFKNVRTEQTTDSSSFAFYLKHNYNIQTLKFENCIVTDRNVMYLRKVVDVSFDNICHAPDAGLTDVISLDADSTVSKIKISNCFWQAGTTNNLTNHECSYAITKNPSTGSLPPSAEFNLSSTTGKYFLTDQFLRSTSVSLANGSIAAIATAGTSGFIFITCSLGFNAIYGLQWATTSTYEISDPTGSFYTVKDSADLINIYWSAANNRFEIQNNKATTASFTFVKMGAYSGSFSNPI